MSTPKLSEADIAATIEAIHTFTQHLHLDTAPDSRTAVFLVGVAEVVLRVRSQGTLSTCGADLASAYTTKLAVGSETPIMVKDEPEAYQAGLMAGAAFSATLRTDYDCWLLRAARGVSRAHGLMGLGEAIAVIAVGGKGSKITHP